MSESPAPPHADESRDPAPIDLDSIDADLDGVERALARLADGTYWIDEITGRPLDPAALEADPIGRRSIAETGTTS